MKYKALLTVCLLLLSVLCAEAAEKNKTIVKSFKVTNATSIEVINKYGKVQVIPWDKDSLKFEINLSVRSNSLDRLEKIYNNVDFDFISTPGFITAKTIIGSRNTSVWTDISTLTKTMFANGSNMTIDYTVYMPRKNKLVVENKYGDIFTDVLQGPVVIDLAHGNLRSNSFTGNTEISIRYGEAHIREMSNGVLNLEYTDLNLTKAKKIKVDSKSGEIDIDEAEHLNYVARRGEYKIDKVKSVIGESSFTSLNFKEISEKLYLESNYGSLTVNYIHPNFKRIDLEVKYGDVNLTFDENTTYSVEIIHKNSTITFPKDKAELNTITSSEDDKEKKTTGKIGTATTVNSSLDVNMDRTTLNLFSK